MFIRYIYKYINDTGHILVFDASDIRFSEDAEGFSKKLIIDSSKLDKIASILMK